MKIRILLLFVFLFLFIGSLSAEKAAEVTMRYGKQENTVRIVLEAPDELVKNTNTITSLTAVRIDFPSAVELRKQKDFLFETIHKDRFLVIYLRDVVDVRAYKLTNPARIVIDLRTAAKPDTRTSQEMQLPAQKGPKEQAAPPDAAKAPAAGQSVPQKQQQPAAQTPAATAPEKTRRLRLLVIDPGHGGYDQGIALQETREKDLSLTLAKELSAVLAKKGLTVFLTRKTDQPLSLQDRISFALSKKPDIFISLHASATDRWAVYTSAADETNTDTAIRLYSMASKQERHLEKSRTLANALGTAIRREFRGTVALRELFLPLLTSLDAPSVIIEYPLAGNSAYDQKMRDRLIKSLLSGLAAYEQ
jgi:N-acetylmuramoyl-L-alanine amidase